MGGVAMGLNLLLITELEILVGSIFKSWKATISSVKGCPRSDSVVLCSGVTTEVGNELGKDGITHCGGAIDAVNGGGGGKAAPGPMTGVVCVGGVGVAIAFISASRAITVCCKSAITWFCRSIKVDYFLRSPIISLSLSLVETVDWREYPSDRIGLGPP
ncbi:hypothetical protein RIF29_26106 [Crotalaria pallida]|uniref:Uncharacterized protein n=1 Tax=Crotalaria pallida TaxID=3830 RepID=A0AAN9I4M8_CROPI